MAGFPDNSISSPSIKITLFLFTIPIFLCLSHFNLFLFFSLPLFCLSLYLCMFYFSVGLSIYVYSLSIYVLFLCRSLYLCIFFFYVCSLSMSTSISMSYYSLTLFGKQHSLFNRIFSIFSKEAKMLVMIDICT